MPSPKVIQLRQILADKFPGLRLHLDENPVLPADVNRSELPPLLDLFQNHLVKGALHELVADETTAGSATLTRAFIRWAVTQNKIIALVDGADSFDATALPPYELARLLWVRCCDADKSMKVMDLLLRDGNLPLILLDLKLSPESQIRKIPATAWYRLQRLVEITSATCLIMTPRPLVAPAQIRLHLKSVFSLPDLEKDSSEIEAELNWEIAEAHHSQKTAHVHSA